MPSFFFKRNLRVNMAFLKRLSRITKPILDVPSALNTQRLRRDARTLKELFRIAFRRRRESLELENFDEAVERLHLTEKDLLARQREFKVLAWILLGIFFILLGYVIFNVYAGNWYAVGPSLVVSLIVLMLSFRYCFWYFQVKNKQLGYTFREWWHSFKGK